MIKSESQNHRGGGGQDVRDITPPKLNRTILLGCYVKEQSGVDKAYMKRFVF